MRTARQAGDLVVFGDSADEQVLKSVGLDAASVVVVTFADVATSIGIVRAIRRLRVDVPVLVRTQDDSQLEALHVRAGIEGVLQELPLQVGQRVVPGTTLAKVVQPNRLKPIYSFIPRWE